MVYDQVYAWNNSEKRFYCGFAGIIKWNVTWHWLERYIPRHTNQAVKKLFPTFRYVPKCFYINLLWKCGNKFVDDGNVRITLQVIVFKNINFAMKLLVKLSKC